ncbi:uncharacterized protein LAESUDRAFT_37369 [Laetiporus sulphureus 93-53]|uniref:Uncharacterized protein n=1 Tax=Laetiporus sulphureus 93-53 TaxID=1314785 RepID=A0A165IM36_9APHY|nr:uncharacterized protein LAESUDRAFT_37369 [Laetiporus sulphureus 93-53]KZT13270.1 hypothetical protein LAESUDRAFT_37369 [Laetiporus sulphureus 93-53]
MAALQFAHQFEHVAAMSLPQQNAVAGPSGLAQSALVQVTIPEAPNGRPSSGSGRPLSRSGLLTPPLSAGTNSFSQSRLAMQMDASKLYRPNNVSPSVAGPSHHRHHHSHVLSQQQVVQNNRMSQGYISELSQQPNLLHTIQQQQHYGGMARRPSQAQMDDQRNRPAMQGPLPPAQMQMTSNNSSTNSSTGFSHLQFQYPQFSSGHTNPAPISAQQQMQPQGTSSGPAPHHAQHAHASRSNAIAHVGANAPAASPTNPQPGIDVFGPAPPNIFDPARWDPNGMAAIAFVSSRKFLEASQQTLATELTRLKDHYRTREACAAQTFTNRISDLYRCLANAKSERDTAVQAQQEAEESCKRAQEAEAKTKEHCTSLYTASLRIDKECMLVKKERDELKNENWELKQVIARMAIEENVRIKKDPSVSEEEKKAVAERVAEREAVIASAFAQAKENEMKLREEVEKRAQLERELEVLKHIVKQQLYQVGT